MRDLDAPVELMIGSNAAQLLVAQEVRHPEEGSGPCGVKTCLGWYVIGPRYPGVEGECDSRAVVHFLRVTEPRASKQSDLTDMFHSMYEAEFKDTSDDSEALSVNDQEWLVEVKATIRKDDEGHYEVALPRNQLGDIPDSLPTARRRFESLRGKFKRDPKYFESYREIIRSLDRDGYAIRVPDDEVCSQPVWYLPHHGVQETEKGKLRVVFDCAAQSNGVGLNDMLKRGPNLTNSLVGVLCRFREGPVAFTCDVEAMYHRVHVPESDSDMLRFLWFCDDDLDGEVEVWKMRSHVFGAVSSSSVASLALRQCAAEGAEQFPEAAEVLVRNSYVDDVAVAVTSVDDAVGLAHDLKALCGRGAFNMRKFTSNSAAFLKEISEEDRGKNLKDLDLDKDRLMTERTLGLKWEVNGDSFCFDFTKGDRPVSRRGILSTVSSIFDPLGIIAPVTLVGKALLQRLCSLSCSWDDMIPDELADEWAQWLSEARQLDSVRLDRDISGPPGVVLRTELHIFADASEVAHAAVAYVRREVQTVSGGREVSVGFVFGKARVNPIRCVQTVPRLELTAATLAVGIKQLLIREMAMELDSVRLWTDSLIVLSWIRNRTSRLRTFVANRLSQIRSATEVADWAYVPSKSNPADVGSRGARPGTLRPWLGGPGFLSQDKDGWPEEPSVAVELPEDEVKVSACVGQVGLSDRTDSPTDSLVRHYSSFYRLKKAVAWFRRFCDVIKSGEYRRYVLAKRRGLRARTVAPERSLTVADLESAEVAIVRHVQRGAVDFPSLDVEGPVKVRRDHPLSQLRPCVKGGLLVVGGRIGESLSVSERVKHPVILPRKHHVSRLLIRDAHCSVGHQGRDHTFWKLRERYWVIGASAEIRQMLRSCVVCRRVNSRPQQQLMADLPSERVTPETPAFSYVGLDVFGPIAVKSGRGERLRYGLMCTCMVTRGVHVELLDSLRSDSMINAIRRIAARRGPVRYVVSDMGTNLVGAERELREALQGLDREHLQRAALAEGIDWKFNPPTGSHFGGFTERQIRTFRKVWNSMPVQGRVDEETLRTLFCEVEAILNNRPLTYISTSSGNLEPLTPAHLLLLRAGGHLMAGDYSDADSFSRRRWRQVQYLAGQFWIRFRDEFLPTLQKRQKWTSASRNVTDGDVVLLVDPDVPRGQWKMGRVVRTIPGKDGLVRKAVVKTGTSSYLRPVHKLVLIQSTDLEW
ncbi:uncharacterized protein LOC122391117 [Amphibalanus amphitrite]|uniref:uncharacterized protein LOC122391117 n=1 Tax=Amphibalanus amphitrite TaxID=1232801 RepID=UPI001C926D15|nr:uncharacterized protein LOC122391117 [Amphibalanus amphitrite]